MLKTASIPGVLVQRYGCDALDASLPLAVLTLSRRPDPRIRATVLALPMSSPKTDWCRYRAEETDDGLAGEEGAHRLLFWLVSALFEIGEVTRARRLCERLRRSPAR